MGSEISRYLFRAFMQKICRNDSSSTLKVVETGFVPFPEIRDCTVIASVEP